MTINFTFSIIDRQRCKVTGIECSDYAGESITELTVPSFGVINFRCYRVTEIADGMLDLTLHKDVYRAMRNLREVKLPPHIEVIGNNAFKGCPKLETINFPLSLKKIGNCAFLYCESLILPEFPKHLQHIGGHAFDGCRMAHQKECTLKLPNSIRTVLDKAFGEYLFGAISAPLKFWVDHMGTKSFPDVAHLEVPEGILAIPAKAFSNREKLKSLSLPSSCYRIGEGAFEFCKNLSTLRLAEGLSIIGKDAFMRSAVLTSDLVLPSTITSIGTNAFATAPGEFEGAPIEVSVTLPSGPQPVKYGSEPFHYNYNLTKFCGTPKALLNAASTPKFFNGTGIKDLQIPMGVRIVDITGCPNLSTLALPESVIEINAIARCQSLKAVALPASVKRVQSDAFYSSSFKITAPLAVWQTILSTRGALTGYATERLVVPEGVLDIAEDVLHGSKIKYLSLPKSLKVIGSGAVSHCDVLRTVEIHNPNVRIRTRAFSYLPSIRPGRHPATQLPWPPVDNSAITTSNPNELMEFGYVVGKLKIEMFLSKDDPAITNNLEALKFMHEMVTKHPEKCRLKIHGVAPLMDSMDDYDFVTVGPDGGYVLSPPDGFPEDYSNVLPMLAPIFQCSKTKQEAHSVLDTMISALDRVLRNHDPENCLSVEINFMGSSKYSNANGAMLHKKFFRVLYQTGDIKFCPAMVSNHQWLPLTEFKVNRLSLRDIELRHYGKVIPLEDPKVGGVTIDIGIGNQAINTINAYIDKFVETLSQK